MFAILLPALKVFTQNETYAKIIPQWANGPSLSPFSTMWTIMAFLFPPTCPAINQQAETSPMGFSLVPWTSARQRERARMLHHFMNLLKCLALHPYHEKKNLKSIIKWQAPVRHKDDEFFFFFFVSLKTKRGVTVWLIHRPRDAGS